MTGVVASMAVEAALLCGAVLVADAALARGGFRRFRHALWLLVLAKLALPPAAAAPWAVELPAELAPALRDGGGSRAAGPAGASAWTWAAVATWATVATWAALATWAAGAALVGTAFVLREAAFRRHVSREEVPGAAAGCAGAVRRAAAAFGVRPPRTVVTRAVSAPAVAGVLRPVLLLPASRDRTTGAALLHEMAHLRRRDPLVRGFAAAVCAVWWFHPAAWIAAVRLASLREVCADLDASEALRDRAPAYRDAFVASARRAVSASGDGPLLAWGGGVIADRLDALRTFRRRSRGARLAGTALAVAAACAALPAQSRPSALPPVADAMSVLAEGPSVHGCMRTQLALLRLAAAEQP